MRATPKRRIWRHGCGGTCEQKRGADCPKRHGGGLVLDEPKTTAGRREVQIPAMCVSALREHRERQNAELGSSDMTGQRYVFTRPNGEPIDPRDMTSAYHELTMRAGLGRGRFHALRHSAASLMLAQQVPLETVSKILGHSG